MSEHGSADPAPATEAPRLSVVFSFRNESDVLPELLRRTRTVLRNAISRGELSSFELVFVNDASTDQSLEILCEAARGQNDIRVLNMSRNFGVTPCVLAGMEHATGDAVVYMDADLQDPPEVIPDMVRAWRNGTAIDVVHTVRRSRAGESRVKLGITALGYRILRSVSSVDLRIEAGDFKLLSRRAVDELVRLREKKPFLRGMVSWIGFGQTHVFYDREARYAGDTKFPVLGIKVIRNFLESALISFSGAPLQLSTLLGGVTSLCAFAILLYVLAEKALGHNIPGWTAIMAAVLFLGGMQMLLLGIIGLYINSMYLELKGRPNYIVESTVGFPAGEELPSASRRAA